MFPTAFLVLCFVFQWASTAALPRRYNDTLVLQKARGLDIPIRTSKVPGGIARRGDVSGSIGLGNNADLLYTVPIELGNTVVAVNIDTGSSDLWVVSDTCTAGTCAGSAVTRYPESSLISAGADVSMFYGDSSTGTHAFGSVGLDTATIAGVTMTQQSFGLVNDTNNQIVQFSTAGIFGLGFPSGSKIQEAVTVAKHGAIDQTDDFLRSTYTSGPLLTRIAMTGALEMPMFSITLQRSTIDISGTGLLTIGKLPDGVDNSTLTWVPVRLYDPVDGGLDPPTFAPNEVYPFRWEIDIDAVYFDGQKLPDSTIQAIDGVDSKRVSALIDTGNSLLRGPEDVVNNILTSVSPSYNPNQSGAVPTLPCNLPKTISFQIGGKMFPIDPRDFIGQQNTGDATTCVADNLVTTDPPSMGSLFRWSLGAPFLRSNLVAFHYGNLTHPSVDPPRIGIKSNVPANAAALLKQAVADAVNNGGNFEQTLVVAPTASAAAEPQITVSPGSFTSQSTITTILTSTTPATTPARGGSTTLSLAAPDNTAAPVSNTRNAASSLVPAFYRDTWFYLVPSFFFLLM
ncbi:aspartic peptidase domain-containing protein [Crucibulum laeve]|uniref:Aspartic peptidase domain-containing protein n=1 Tax=Crucibulum laeve TaxID=68775 RepID=A0A5C3M1B7_9AGAR|nr:aspartic peptidase domain-containing protein [Crucibulum laeve]